MQNLQLVDTLNNNIYVSAMNIIHKDITMSQSFKRPQWWRHSLSHLAHKS